MAECGSQPSHRNSGPAITIAIVMPGMAPNTATPMKQVIDSQQIDRRSGVRKDASSGGVLPAALASTELTRQGAAAPSTSSAPRPSPSAPPDPLARSSTSG